MDIIIQAQHQCGYQGTAKIYRQSIDIEYLSQEVPCIPGVKGYIILPRVFLTTLRAHLAEDAALQLGYLTLSHAGSRVQSAIGQSRKQYTRSFRGVYIYGHHCQYDQPTHRHSAL